MAEQQTPTTEKVINTPKPVKPIEGKSDKSDTLAVLPLTPQQIDKKQAEEKAVKEREEQARTTKKKTDFLQDFEKSIGIITIACETTGISRETYYNWVKTDKEFRDKAGEILERQRSQVEDRLLKAILKDHVSAITFYLKNKHPEYKEKLQVSAGGVKTLEDLLDDDDMEQEEIIKKENENKQGADRKIIDDKGQAGKTGQVQVKHGAVILPVKKDPPKLNNQSPAKGNK